MAARRRVVSRHVKRKNATAARRRLEAAQKVLRGDRSVIEESGRRIARARAQRQLDDAGVGLRDEVTQARVRWRGYWRVLATAP